MNIADTLIIVERIYEIGRLRGLCSANQICRAAGVSAMALKNISESNESPQFKMLKSFAKGLNCTIMDIIYDMPVKNVDDYKYIPINKNARIIEKMLELGQPLRMTSERAIERNAGLTNGRLGFFRKRTDASMQVSVFKQVANVLNTSIVKLIYDEEFPGIENEPNFISQQSLTNTNEIIQLYATELSDSEFTQISLQLPEERRKELMQAMYAKLTSKTRQEVQLMLSRMFLNEQKKVLS